MGEIVFRSDREERFGAVRSGAFPAGFAAAVRRKTKPEMKQAERSMTFRLSFFRTPPAYFLK